VLRRSLDTSLASRDDARLGKTSSAIFGTAQRLVALDGLRDRP